MKCWKIAMNLPKKVPFSTFILIIYCVYFLGSIFHEVISSNNSINLICNYFWWVLMLFWFICKYLVCKYLIFTYLYILGENMENAFIYCITNIWFNRAMDCQIIGFSIGFSIFCPWYDSLQSCLEIYFHLNGTWSCMYFFCIM